MTGKQSPHAEPESHDDHTLTTVHLLVQDDGVPYELDQVQCVQCGQVLEGHKRRLAA